MKSYVLDELEHQWGGFLIDFNAKETLPLFAEFGLKARVTAYRDDRETVHEGWEAAELSLLPTKQTLSGIPLIIRNETPVQPARTAGDCS